MRIADSPVEIVVGQVLWSIEDPATGDAGTRMMSEADLVEMLGGDEFVRSSLATRRPGGIPMFVTLSEGDTSLLRPPGDGRCRRSLFLHPDQVRDQLSQGSAHGPSLIDNST